MASSPGIIRIFQQVGTLCVSFCRAFESMFRAVITNICRADIEVHYVDYGNYETVNKDDLKSISNLVDIFSDIEVIYSANYSNKQVTNK